MNFSSERYIKFVGIKGERTDDRRVTIDAVGLRRAIQSGEIGGGGADTVFKGKIVGIEPNAAHVETPADLLTYVGALSANDENIEGIEMLTSQVVIRYFNDGKLFGFIPIRFASTNTIDASASASERVKVRFPWFSVLIWGPPSQQELENDLNAGLNFDIQNSASAYARAMQMVINVLKTKHDTVKNSISNVR